MFSFVDSFINFSELNSGGFELILFFEQVGESFGELNCGCFSIIFLIPDFVCGVISYFWEVKYPQAKWSD